MNPARQLSYQPVSSSESNPAGWRSLLTHTHMLQGELPEPDNRTNLTAWATERAIDAMGVGSPFTPETCAAYAIFEEKGRDNYYSGTFDPQSVKRGNDVQELIADLNRIGGGSCFYYLDNETPKARYGHMWWVGWQHDFPEWHDYDQPFDRWMCQDQSPADHSPEPMPYERRPYMEIVARQRMGGALGMWAHPTSWWKTGTGAFVTNIASEMPAHLAADGYIDGLVIMGYDPYRPSYLELWFHLLDLGYEVLGVAETDIGLSSAKLWNMSPLLLTWFQAGNQSLSTPGIIKSLRSANVYVSSGPEIRLEVDGQPMGTRVPTQPGQNHRISIHVETRPRGEQLGRLELLARNGKVIWSMSNPEDGTYTLEVPGSSEPNYMIARVFGRGDLPETKPSNEIRCFAITNPVYLRPENWQAPGHTMTEVTVSATGNSPYLNGAIRFETATGDLLEQGILRGSDSIRITMPASGRIQLRNPDGQTQSAYLINANPRIMELQRYLYRGGFLEDYPDTAVGDVPWRAFRTGEFREALATLQLLY